MIFSCNYIENESQIIQNHEVNNNYIIEAAINICHLEEDTIILYNTEKDWSTAFYPEENYVIKKKVEPIFVVDTMNQIVYFNYYGDFLYKLDINNGNVLNKTVLFNDLYSRYSISYMPNIEISNQYVIFYYANQLLLFDSSLNLVRNFNSILEKEEFKRFGLIKNDTLIIGKLSSTPSILFSDDYFLDTLMYEFYSGFINVKYRFINFYSLHDTTLILREKL